MNRSCLISKFKHGLDGATLHATRQRVHSLATERAVSKLPTLITHGIENARQSATSAKEFVQHLRDELKNFSVL
jgi:hypothetical protein